ncbi:MAG: isopentenyl phosphate kinase [Nitrososphaerota archaeon]|nr:isopentenyl phosphate kinase [Aigarchaeota archaeon]MDW8077102.1 isopentenyl phosphate kinase [Nitrososphaerota archaeon]
MGKLIVIKLGGSVITNKHEPFSFNREVVLRIGKELKSSWPTPLIIVHGGGSFGHPIADAYDIKKGYQRAEQLKGFMETVNAMRRLNNLVVSALSDANLPVIGIPPSCTVITNNGDIETCNFDPVFSAMEIGLIPVMYGDAVFDRKLKFTILSGDTLASYIAMRLKAKQLIFAVDVDGVYGFDREASQRFLIEELNEKIHMSIKYEPTEGDVTGGMFYKVEEALAAARHGVEVYIINGLVPGRIEAVIKGQKVVGTRVKIA